MDLANKSHGLPSFTPVAVISSNLRSGSKTRRASSASISSTISSFDNLYHLCPRIPTSCSPMAFRGRMPVSDLLPYEWYDTPNIHFCTVRDFEILCAEKNITVLHRQVVNEQSSRRLKDLSPNLFGETAIYHLCRNGA